MDIVIGSHDFLNLLPYIICYNFWFIPLIHAIQTILASTYGFICKLFNILGIARHINTSNIWIV